MFQDLRHALRRLLRTPGFSALAVLTLALAFGAHVSIFNLIHALFLQPLSVSEPDRLVGLYQSRDGEGFFPLSLPDFEDYRETATTFGDLAAHYPSAPLSLTSGDGLEEINGSVVSDNYFSLLGVEPARGRFFLPGEGEAPGAHPVAVVSHSMWQGRLGGREDVVGTELTVNGQRFEVVGVAPQSFAGVQLRLPVELWVTTSMASVGYRWCDAVDRDCTWVLMIGRLAPDRTLAEARSEMEALAAGVAEAHPLPDETVSGGRARGLSLAPLAGVHPASRPYLQRIAGLLLATVTLVVLVAGANLGGLLLARSLSRRREVATRLALGAPRRRVISLFLVETLLLALAGGALGLLAARGFGHVVALFYPSREPLELGIQPASVAWAALLAVAVGLLVGLVPGLQASRRGLVPALKEPQRPRLLAALVVAQVSLTFILLTCTGLVARSMGNLSRIGDLDPSTVATLRLRPRLVGYGPEQARDYRRQVVERLAGLPAVRSVSFSRGLPPFPFFNPVAVSRAKAADADAGPRVPEAWTDEISPGVFATLDIPLLAGRDFGAADRPGGPPVAIVNQTLADALWPGGEVVGETLAVGEKTFQVVGLVRDAAHLNQVQEPIPQIYTPYGQNPRQIDARLTVRVDGDAGPLLAALRREAHAVDPRVPVTEVGTMRGRLERGFAPVFLAGRVLTASGGLALFLGALGLYGILALTVALRTRELGIRRALGGTRSHVSGLVFTDALKLAGLALVVGLGLALLVTRTLGHYLYGVSARDPLTFAAALLALALVALLASWWPARRAGRVDPRIALRLE